MRTARRGCRRPRPPRRQKTTACSRPKAAEHAVQNRSIGTLAGQAQARQRQRRVQCTKSAQRGGWLEISWPNGRPGGAGYLYATRLPAYHPGMTRDDVKEILDRVLTWLPG